MAIGVCVVLPLSLVKDITSLSSASNVAIGIYSIFVLQVLGFIIKDQSSGKMYKPDTWAILY